jgi:hypothetical protein
MSGLLEKAAARQFSLLVMMGLCATTFVPAARGQSATGAATTGAAPAQAQSSTASKAAAGPATQAVATGQNSSQAGAQSAAQSSSQTEPQMQDQSAPAAESLGEAARRARAQKAKTATAKVYSDDSVSNLSGHGVSVVGDGQVEGRSSDSASSAGSAGASGATGSSGGAGGGEQYWRGRANAIRAQMAQCDQKISEIQDEITKHGAVTVDPMSGAQAGVIFVEDRNAQIKQVEQQKEGLQSQLDELAEEGRKAGADSGWFR